MLKPCEHCKNIFKTYRSIRRFCSKSCAVFHVCPIPKNGKNLTCTRCNSTFYRSHSRIKKFNFCSRDCQVKYCEKFTADFRWKKPKTPKPKRVYKSLWINGKTIPEHRHIMQQHLGRTLETWEHVHHINNDPQDNRLENLVVLHRTEHAKLTNKENNLFDR